MFELSYSQLITVVNIVILLSLSLFTKVKTDVIFLIIMAIFLLSGVLDIDQTFSGFTSNAVLVAAFFAVMVQAMNKTHIVQLAMFRILGNETRLNRVLMRLIAFTVALSMFIPNLVVGIMMYSGVDDWARRHNLRSSKLLLPVGYAIGIGSCFTFLGRTGGLVWADMYETYTGDDLSMFSPFWLGLICAIVWIIYIMLFQDRIPDKDSSLDIADKVDDFIIELKVTQNSKAVGKSLAECGLYASDDFNIVSITSYDDVTYCDIMPDMSILGGDKLLFSGDIGKILQLADQYGFETIDKKTRESGTVFSSTSYKQLAVVPRGSYLVGKKFSEIDFEKKHNVILMALARQGEFLTNNPRHIEINAWDLIILNGNKLNWTELKNILIKQDSDKLINYDWHSIVSAVIIIAVLILSSLELVPLAEAAMVGAMLVAFCGCISHKDALSAIPWTTIIIIAGSFALGVALKTSGLSEDITNCLLNLCGTNVFLSLIVLTGITIILTQLIADNAVIPLILPIAITTATHLNCPTFPFALAVFMASNAKVCTSFCAPHMAQCAAQGQYTEKEILHFGWPAFLLLFISIVVGLNLYL